MNTYHIIRDVKASRSARSIHVIMGPTLPLSSSSSSSSSYLFVVSLRGGVWLLEWGIQKLNIIKNCTP